MSVEKIDDRFDHLERRIDQFEATILRWFALLIAGEVIILTTVDLWIA